MTFIDIYVVVVCNINEKWMIYSDLWHNENNIFFCDIFCNISVNIAQISVKSKDSRCLKGIYHINHQNFVVSAFYAYLTIYVVSCRQPLWEFEIKEQKEENPSISWWKSVINKIFIINLTNWWRNRSFRHENRCIIWTHFLRYLMK